MQPVSLQRCQGAAEVPGAALLLAVPAGLGAYGAIPGAGGLSWSYGPAIGTSSWAGRLCTGLWQGGNPTAGDPSTTQLSVPLPW